MLGRKQKMAILETSRVPIVHNILHCPHLPFSAVVRKGLDCQVLVRCSPHSRPQWAVLRFQVLLFSPAAATLTDSRFAHD